MTFNKFMRWFLLLPAQSSTVARSIDDLHYFVIITTFVGAFGVFLMTGIFVVRYRRRSEGDTTPVVKAGKLVEAIYIVGPLILFLVWFFMGFSRYRDLQNPPPNSMVVYVTAKQWMWKFTYPEGPNSIDVLRVPAGRPVRLLMTSRDVIHSFFVPAFRIKQDVVPGRYTQVWFQTVGPGRWRVLCTEFCGLQHSQMLADVIAMAPADYEKWLDDQRRGLVSRADAGPGPAEFDLPAGRLEPGPHETAPGPYVPRPMLAGSLARQGERVAAEVGCLKCHTVNGEKHIGPTWLGLYMKRVTLSDGSTVIADEAYLTESMMDPQAKVVAGFEDVMPTFQGRLTAPQVAALVEYIKSLEVDRTDEAVGARP